jgi:hypothetical protein
MSMKRIEAGSEDLPFNSRSGMMPSGIRSFDMTVPIFYDSCGEIGRDKI